MWTIPCRKKKGQIVFSLCCAGLLNVTPIRGTRMPDRKNLLMELQPFALACVQTEVASQGKWSLELETVPLMSTLATCCRGYMKMDTLAAAALCHGNHLSYSLVLLYQRLGIVLQHHAVGLLTKECKQTNERKTIETQAHFLCWVLPSQAVFFFFFQVDLCYFMQLSFDPLFLFIQLSCGWISPPSECCIPSKVIWTVTVIMCAMTSPCP